MTRRNNKRNNRRNRQSNNTPELPPFAQMLFGAILGKGVDMIAKKMAENNEETPDIHAEGISNQDVTNINNGKATLSKLRIPSDGSAVEYPIPDNLQFFFNEDGKLMVCKKTEHETAPDNKKGNPITYDDILKELFLDKKTYWFGNTQIYKSDRAGSSNYNDMNNCTSESQVKRMIAFNKLMNIAKYLNGDWKPRFDGNSKNWFICIEDEGYDTRHTKWFNDGSIFFKTEETAYEAIRLMGEESLNDLFSTDW